MTDLDKTNPSSSNLPPPGASTGRLRRIDPSLPLIPWWWARVALAVALGVLVTLTYRAIDPYIGEASAIAMLSVLAVIAAAWAGRLLAGLLTLLLCTVAFMYYLEPVRDLRVASQNEARLVLLFFLAGLLVCLVVDSLQAGKLRSRALAQEREQLAASLLLERKRQAALLSNLPGLVWEVRYDRATGALRPTFLSGNSARLIGWSANELVGVPLAERMFGADGAALREALVDVATHGEPRQQKHRWLRFTGEERWFETHLAAGDNEPGTGDGLVRCVSLDVTASKQLDDVLARSERRFRGVVDQVPLLVWVARPGEGIVWTNASWLQFRGRDEAAERGMGWLEGVHPQDASDLSAAALAAFERREEFHFEFRMKRADGAWRWLHSVGIPRLDDAGAFQDYLGFSIDMSDRKQLEMDRDALLSGTEQARQAAELAIQSKDEFLAKVSHELRNPLNGILGWTQILRREDVPEEDLEKGLELIDLGARSLVQLVDDLLDVSRITSGKMRLTLSPTDLGKVVSAACLSVEPSAEAKGVKIERDLGTGIIAVMGDARRLQQVVWNLLANAVKFTPKGGTIQVRIRPESETIALLSVRDSGIGIAPEFLPHVFSAFSQQESSSTRRYRGLGLGLSIVRQLAELHGGTVRAASEGIDQGSTFEVRLPLALGMETTEGTADAVPAVADGRDLELAGVRVLVVDDDPTARELVPRLLAPAGAQVRTADSAEAGLAALLGFHPDVLVSDIEMPGSDGIALLRRVRSLAADEGGATPAVALTAYVREEERQRILLAGFQAHVGKPVDRDALISTIASLHRRSPAAPGKSQPN